MAFNLLPLSVSAFTQPETDDPIFVADIIPNIPGMVFPDSDGIGRGSESGGFGRIPSSPAGEFFA